MNLSCLSLAVCLSLLFSFPVQATPRCPLDVSNPALTQGFLPIHGGPLAGVIWYGDPSEWPYFTFQGHKAPLNASAATNAIVDEAGIILSRDDLGHLHGFETCIPVFAHLNWTGPLETRTLTVPVRVREFHTDASFNGMYVAMGSPVTWDPGSVFTGNAMVTSATGHLTFAQQYADWNGFSNTRRPALNGWTNLEACTRAQGIDRSTLDSCGFVPVWTEIVGTPGAEGMTSTLSSFVNANFPTDPGGSVWGTLITELFDKIVPVLVAPFNTVQDLRNGTNLISRVYAGDGTIMGSRKEEARVDMDLHAWMMTGDPKFLGRHLTTPLGVLDPAEIGVGTHPLTFLSQTTTPHAGVPGVAGPDELVTAILGFTIQVGEGGPPPPPRPTDCVIGPWVDVSSSTTVSPVTTAGLIQTRTVNTTVQQQRTLTPPTNGGAACPVN